MSQSRRTKPSDLMVEYPEIDEMIRKEGDPENNPPKRTGKLRVHAYFSTACQHGFHAECRLSCKFCGTLCRCGCGHKRRIG